MRKQKVFIKSLSHEVSLRDNPWDPYLDDKITKTLKPGDKLEIDLDSAAYDWTDRLFYEAYQYGSRLGFINAEAIDIEMR